jgi:hypothetical protein
MDAERRRRLEDAERATLDARRRRLAEVPIEQRLLEAIALSAAVLADALRRGRTMRDRPLPPGLGSRVR